MDISAFGMAGVAAITVICYLVGWIVKVSGLDCLLYTSDAADD